MSRSIAVELAPVAIVILMLAFVVISYRYRGPIRRGWNMATTWYQGCYRRIVYNAYLGKAAVGEWIRPESALCETWQQASDCVRDVAIGEVVSIMVEEAKPPPPTKGYGEDQA